jgi:uncharacterized phage protein (TIGR01671 family)
VAMREIKFRAWDNYKKLMRYDFLVASKDGEPFSNNLLAYPEWELMQYTGLKDKNGKEIYEGDIVVKEYPNHKFICVVYYFFGEFRAITHYDPECLPTKEWTGNMWYVGFGRSYPDCSVADVEVIGNIYEHSYLLDTKTEK